MNINIDLIKILDEIEKEKGISKEVLIDTCSGQRQC